MRVALLAVSGSIRRAHSRRVAPPCKRQAVASTGNTSSENSRVRVIVFAGFEPLCHVHVHVVPGGGVVVYLHRDSVRHVPREVKLGHQVLAGLDVIQQQGTAVGEGKNGGVAKKKRAHSMLFALAPRPPSVRRSATVAKVHQWQMLQSQWLPVRQKPKKLDGGKVETESAALWTIGGSRKKTTATLVAVFRIEVR